MTSQQRALAVLNLAGGVAVLGSYAYCLATHPESRDGLWGDVPSSLQPFYTVSMVLAAVGYFPFTAYLLWGIEPAEVRILGGWGFGAFLLFYALILIPSALWMPLTFRVMAGWDGALWLSIRAVLALVALGSLALLAALLTMTPKGSPFLHALAIAGALAFCVQTALLDAVVWPAFFPSAHLK